MTLPHNNPQGTTGSEQPARQPQKVDASIVNPFDPREVWVVHTSAPAPEHMVSAYAHGKVDGAKAAREEALSLLEEWDYHNNRNFGKPHPILFDMIRMVRDNPEEVRKHLESLRGGKE